MNKQLSFANIVVGISTLFTLTTFMMLLLIGGNRFVFSLKTILCLVLIGILFLFYVVKKFPIYVFSNKLEGREFTIKNPFTMFFLMFLMPKGKFNIFTLTGTYKIHYQQNNLETIYVNQSFKPKLINYIKDISLLFFLIFLHIGLCIISLDIFSEQTKFLMLSAFVFLYLITFSHSMLERWICDQISFTYKDNIRISPLLQVLGLLGTINNTGKRILINPNIIENSDDNVSRYIVAHEKGHIENKDYIFIILLDICLFFFGITFVVLQILENGYTFISYPLLCFGFVIAVQLLIKREKKADKVAVKLIGAETCLKALSVLNMQQKYKKNEILLNGFLIKFVLRLFLIFKGGITIERRINYIKELQNKKH